MDYFKLLNFRREPFSNSPDPDLFYPSRLHRECLQQTEISVRLHRGLNVVLGEVGTGKTTVCRQLLRNLSNDEDARVFLILDPGFDCTEDFLLHLCYLLLGRRPARGSRSQAELKEDIKNALLYRVVEQGQLVTLLVDEAQKMPLSCLETVRELLNFETNTYKLLQIVLFAQPDFEETLRRRENLADRVNLCYWLEPLSLRDTRRLIRFRMQRTLLKGAKPPIFSPACFWLIQRYTGGYPRQIVHLCHKLLLAAIVRKRRTIGSQLVLYAARRPGGRQIRTRLARKTLSPAPAALGLCICFLLLAPLLQKHPATPPAPGEAAREARIGTAPEGPATADALSGSLSLPRPVSPASSGSAAGGDTRPADRMGHGASPPGRSGQPPEVLGSLRIPPGETLWNLIRAVYNVSDAETVKQTLIPAVLRANPGLASAHEIEAGSVLRLPVVPELSGGLPPGFHIVLRQCRDLEALYSLAQRKRYASKPRVIVWSKNFSKTFLVLDLKSYKSVHAARSHLKNLPNSVEKRAKIVKSSQFSEKRALLFTNQRYSGANPL
jgi:general secretion pathway protein A